MRKRFLISVIFVIGMIFLLSIGVFADEADYSDTKFEVSGFPEVENLSDADRATYSTAVGEASVILSRTDGISSLYIVHDTVPKVWSVTDADSGKSFTCGAKGFLHEYVDVSELFGSSVKSLTLSFSDGASICDIYAFSEGELPDFVQIWDEPLERADLMLVSSHSDDEQLFFAGVLPYYAGERGLDVQVIYMVQHFELYGEINHQRPHEQLDGLWAVGIRNYPVISNFPDLYAESDDRETAFSEACAAFAAEGVTYDDFVKYLTDNIRRFKPLVVVSHDLDGEYGHGTHVMCSAALADAVKLAADASYDIQSAEQYGGAWCVNKLYFHLYGENKITLDLDTPLEAFDGKTAFEMTQYGFSFHESQHWTWFNEWIYGTDDEPITRATQIKKYSPCEYGLYFTSVGYDSEGGDFFENVTPYSERNDVSGSIFDILETAGEMSAEDTAENFESETVPVEDVGAKRTPAISQTVVVTVVVICIMACIVLGVFIAYSSKNARSRAARRRRRGSHRR